LAVMAIIGRWLLTTERSVQPSEIAKLGAIVYMAVWLADRRTELRDITVGLIPFATLLGVIAALIVLQPNFSTAALLVATATAMFFAAGADMKQLLIAFLVGGIALLIVAVAADYRLRRLGLWLANPLSDASGEGFQVVQVLAALSKGRFFGVGLGQSQQKLGIYAPHSDGMFAIVAEEWGFMGAAVLIALYALWVWRGLFIARQAPDAYGMLLAVGLTSWVTFQAALHIAVITASVPFTGTLLPFVSYGGSSLMSGMAAVGILLNISRAPQNSDRERAP
jgi:cell division protein FtsW